MTKRYAEGTETTVEKSEQEVKNTLKRYGADGIAIYTDNQGRGAVYFVMKGRHLRFTVETPPLNAFRYDARGRWRRDNEIKAAREQEQRRRWRVLLIRLKARLEAVEDEAIDFDTEFMANIVLPDNSTVADKLKPKIEEAYSTGNMPTLLDDMFPPQRALPDMRGAP